MMVQKLSLGTANFGGNYGITNKTKLSREEVDEILFWASGKIAELDTSSDYTGSHTAIAKHSSKFKITTKVNLDQITSLKNIQKYVNQVCTDLGTDKIERILLRPHSSDPQFTIEAIWELEKLSSTSLINEFGLSIYETKELQYFAKYIDFPIVFQVPLNLFNRSFQKLQNEHEGRYTKFKFYARSIFLQGLLLMNHRDIPSQLAEAVEPLNLLERELSRTGISTLEATFAFIRDQRWVEGVIVGVNNLDELKKNYEVFMAEQEVNLNFLEEFPNVPPTILDPRNWSPKGA